MRVAGSKDKTFVALFFMASLAFAGVAGSAGLYVWWRWFDPIFPEIKVLHTEIHEREVEPHALDDVRYLRLLAGSRILEVVRIVESSREFDAKLHAFIRRPPPQNKQIEYEGRPVVIDHKEYAIDPISIKIESGVHQRSRIWAVPSDVFDPAGEYSYRSHLESCNPVRCLTFPFPGLTLTIR